MASNGTKTFVLRYLLGGDKQMTIGKCADWSPLNAVKEAHKLRQAIDRGEGAGPGKEASTGERR